MLRITLMIYLSLIANIYSKGTSIYAWNQDTKSIILITLRKTQLNNF